MTAQLQASNSGGRRTQLPEVEQIRADLWSVPVPNPSSPPFTYCYLLVAAEGVVVVDPGWASDSGWLSIVAVLENVGLTPNDIVGVAITHAHRDHHGLSGRIRDETGAWIAMHALEAASFNRIDFDVLLATERSWMRDAGVPVHEMTEMEPDRAEYDQRAALATPDFVLDDGELLPFSRPIRAVWTPGHTAGHLCFYDERNRLMLTGDHVLPRITPHVSQRPGGEASTLAAYLSSLERIAAFDVSCGLPAHEYRIPDLAARTAEIVAHQRDRDGEVLALLEAGPATVWEVAPRLSWSRGWDNTRGLHRRSALAETSAHLIFLLETGKVERTAPDHPESGVPWRLASGIRQAREKETP